MSVAFHLCIDFILLFQFGNVDFFFFYYYHYDFYDEKKVFLLPLALYEAR